MKVISLLGASSMAVLRALLYGLVGMLIAVIVAAVLVLNARANWSGSVNDSDARGG